MRVDTLMLQVTFMFQAPYMKDKAHNLQILKMTQMEAVQIAHQQVQETVSQMKILVLLEQSQVLVVMKDLVIQVLVLIQTLEMQSVKFKDMQG